MVAAKEVAVVALLRMTKIKSSTCSSCRVVLGAGVVAEVVLAGTSSCRGISASCSDDSGGGSSSAVFLVEIVVVLFLEARQSNQ